MSELGVGKEVLSHCNKCKLTLAHIIVTMKANDKASTRLGMIPDKVMCKTCKGTHNFKDPSAPLVKKVAAVKTPGSKSPSRASKSSISQAEHWMQSMNKISKASKEYSIKGNYEIGDIVAHPNFGPGVVERVVDNNKIEVLFRDETRTLIHRK